MVGSMPAIGVRFDVGKLNSDCYGIASWKIFWRALPVQDLKRSLLFEGDTAASCAGRENVYCLALQNSDTAILDKVRAALSASEAFKKVCSTPMFVEGGACTSEPLPEAGKVDDTGTLVGGASNSKPALDVVAAERDRERERQTKAPERTVASERTHNLPAMADFRELRDFIAKTFTPNDAGFASEYWITPEELCDVVEHFTSLVKVQYVDKLARQQSKNLCCVRLFPQNASAPTSVTGEELARKEYIEFVGLFPFLSEQDAASFIKTSAPTPQVARACWNPGKVSDELREGIGTTSVQFLFDIPPSSSVEISVDAPPGVCRRNQTRGGSGSGARSRADTKTGRGSAKGGTRREEPNRRGAPDGGAGCSAEGGRSAKADRNARTNR